MDFTTFKFLVFLTVVAVVYSLAPVRLRAALVTVSSYAFYWTWSGRFSLLLLSATAVAYHAAKLLERAATDRTKRAILVAAVAVLVGLICVFKTVFLWRGLLAHQILIPLGISYYTFKLISYVVDVYRIQMPAERSFVAFAAYTSFFPQMVAGPIQRAESFLAEIHEARPATRNNVVTGVQRILLGYFKKFVVAGNLGLVVDFVYSHLGARGTPVALGFYLYPLQLYADFSGLTDIAVGAALLLGIETPENFNAPFSAVNISGYWRRWHISLTSWLTDYVFSPLRMATRNWGDAGLVFSLTVNLVLIGIWHGLFLNFALFGLLHAFLLCVDALSARARKRLYRQHPAADRATDLFGPVVTFHLVAFGMVFFRGDSLGSIGYVIGHLPGTLAPPTAALTRALVTGLAAYALMEVADWFRRRDRQGELVAQLPPWGRWSVYACTAVTAIMAVMLLLAEGQNRNPFLYAIF